MRSSTQNLTLAALFIALGVLIPWIVHTSGLGAMAGQILLPMFWPVAMAGFFLPLSLAVGIGLAVPLISFLFTGMPPVPLAYVMPFELALLAGITHLVFKYTHHGAFSSLLAGLLISRSAYMLYSLVLSPLLGISSKTIQVTALLYGLPGMAAMLIMIPLILRRLSYTAPPPGGSG